LFKLIYSFLFCIVCLAIVLDSCKKDSSSEDKALYEEMNAIGNFKYYKNNTITRLSSAQSAHNPYFKVRFNTTAYAALSDSGRLPLGKVFPTGSVIVSELSDANPGYIKLYAVMKKTSSQNAVNGWIWAEFLYDGSTAYSTDKKGADCISCHSTNARDQVRVFNQFP
jgi:hypothetical protein